MKKLLCTLFICGLVSRTQNQAQVQPPVKNLDLTQDEIIQRRPYPQDSLSQKLDELMQAYSDNELFSGAVLVVRQGHVFLKKGYGYKNRSTGARNDAHTLFQIASVTKTFTAALVLKLVEEKKLDLQDKLSRFYPGFPRGDSITIEHLLTHTSGLWDYTRNDRIMEAQLNRSFTPQEIMDSFRNQPPDFAPGQGWNYCNAGYFLLGAIIQKVTGLSYDRAIRQYLFLPAGITQSGFDFRHLRSADKAIGYRLDSLNKPSLPMPVADSSVPYAAGAIYATVGDLYRWHQALQQYKRMSKAMMQQAYTPYRNNYGYGWIIDSVKGKKTVSHSGGITGFRSDFYRVPEDDVCIILLCNAEIPSLGNITRRLLAILYNLPYRIPAKRNPIPLPVALLEKYTGTYRIEKNGVMIDVVLENGRLEARPHNGPPSRLLAIDETHFFLHNDPEFCISFERDQSGKTVRLMINPAGAPFPASKVK